MKKTLLIITLLAPLAAFSQTTRGHGITTPATEKMSHPTVKDTTIQITMTLDQFRSLLYVIDQNIDSKKESKQVIDFLIHSAKMEEEKKK